MSSFGDSDDDLEVVTTATNQELQSPSTKPNTTLAPNTATNDQDTGPGETGDGLTVGPLENLPDFNELYQVDLQDLDEKPWRKPGADITDYFNYGFNETTWLAYCNKQKKMREELSGKKKDDVIPPDSIPTFMPPPGMRPPPNGPGGPQGPPPFMGPPMGMRPMMGMPPPGMMAPPFGPPHMMRPPMRPGFRPGPQRPPFFPPGGPPLPPHLHQQQQRPHQQHFSNHHPASPEKSEENGNEENDSQKESQFSSGKSPTYERPGKEDRDRYPPRDRSRDRDRYKSGRSRDHSRDRDRSRRKRAHEEDRDGPRSHKRR